MLKYFGALKSRFNPTRSSREERFARRIFPFSFRITREGAIYILCVLLLSSAAIRTGNNMLFIILAALLSTIAVSGIAGPDGGTPEKPVGTVWIAVSGKVMGSQACRFTFSGGRDMIRRRSAVAAMLFAEARLLGREFLDTRMKW